MWINDYRELVAILVISDLKVRYKNSVIGFAWSMLNPLFIMLILLVVFSNFMRFDVENYALFLLLGLVLWRFFANGTNSAMSSITGRANLVKKVYFPREVLVLSSVLSRLVSAILELFVFFVLFMFLYGKMHWTLLLLPLLILLQCILIFGLGLGLAGLYVFYRDCSQIWEILLQGGFFLTPIFYPVSIVPEKYLQYYMLNPMAMLLEMTKDIVMRGVVPPLQEFIALAAMCLLVLSLGYAIFKRYEPGFGGVV